MFLCNNSTNIVQMSMKGLTGTPGAGGTSKAAVVSLDPSGSITTASGIKDLDAFLTDAIAASGTVSVWFDTVTKLETQATYGGTYTDVTSSLVAPTAWDDATAAGNADNFSGQYEGYYAYTFVRDASAGSTTTTGDRTFEARTYAFDVGRNAASYSDKLLASGEGFKVSYTNGNVTFKQGDTYNGSTVTTVDQLVAYINADTTLDALGIDLQADRAAFERTLLTMNYTISANNGATATAGATSGCDDINAVIVRSKEKTVIDISNNRKIKTTSRILKWKQKTN